MRVDERDEQPGWKYSEWDLRGVPVRIEIGPRDVDAQTCRSRPARSRQGEPGQRRERRTRWACRRCCASCSTKFSARSTSKRSRFSTTHTLAADEPRRVLRALQVARGDDRHPVVRARRVRGARQGGDRRDARVIAPARRAEPAVRRVRRAGKGQSLLCAVLLRLRLSAALALAVAGAAAAALTPTLAEVDATARAAGNRRDVAEQIGDVGLRNALARRGEPNLGKLTSTAT